jgi:hypothetical protein
MQLKDDAYVAISYVASADKAKSRRERTESHGRISPRLRGQSGRPQRSRRIGKRRRQAFRPARHFVNNAAAIKNGESPKTIKDDDMSGPLKGVRVLDLTAVVSGPYATMFLADQGADVLKIEPISGDSARRSRAAIDKAGEFSALFISSNRGKRSLSIDVKSDAGREVLAKLVAQADVLVRNFRPGTMERLGLDADEVRKRHPRQKGRERQGTFCRGREGRRTNRGVSLQCGL